MMRFDAVEYQVLELSVSGMFSLQEEAKERALLLMDLGIFQRNPISRWANNGWTLTEAGKEYHAALIKAVREKHGHVWMTHRDSYPDLYDGEHGETVDFFAYESGYHNGPVCKNCGYKFCQHCICEFDAPECTRRAK